jgi:hypothetical protein|tara:strand:- start:137 stop:949 length:813 start_codon:yes stop_codon:yes gene_type:complete
MAKKRIVLPVYNDRRNTFGWEQRYVEDENTSLVIYEKDDSLAYGQEVKTDEGFKIPNIGRSNFAFLYHICKYYDELYDIELFTKTHVSRTDTMIHESIDKSHQYDHLQFWNGARLMIYTSPEIFGTLSSYWIEECQPTEVTPSCIGIPGSFLYKLKLDEYFDRTLLDSPCSVKGIIYIYDASAPGRYALSVINEIFPGYSYPDVLIMRREDIWAVKKELIQYHPKQFYTDILHCVVSGDEKWAFHRDQWCEFWPMLWEETISRMKQEGAE